jgi:hypothetical protein
MPRAICTRGKIWRRDRRHFAHQHRVTSSTDEEGKESTLAIKVLAFGDCLDEARKEDRVYIEGDSTMPCGTPKVSPSHR